MLVAALGGWGGVGVGWGCAVFGGRSGAVGFVIGGGRGGRGFGLKFFVGALGVEGGLMGAGVAEVGGRFEERVTPDDGGVEEGEERDPGDGLARGG